MVILSYALHAICIYFYPSSILFNVIIPIITLLQKSNMSLVFYDTETTGTDTAFSQILQFGAIRTDVDLNITDRFEIRCRLLPHIVPSPGAMAVTGVTIKQLIDVGLPTHYEMIKAIHEKLRSWSPAIFLGYNSLNFDEHLLRQAFYQTLHPLYLTNTDGNSRIDILRLLHATHLYAPGAIAIPVKENGNPIFKLDQVAPHNGFAHENAHDAMADVEATIHMCRLIRERAPHLWESFNRFSKKKAVTDYAFNELIFSLSEFNYGRPYSSLVTTIGIHPKRNTDIFVFDLAIDPSSLAAMPVERHASQLKKTPKPIRILKSNACPTMRPVAEAPAIAEAMALGMEELLRRANVLKSDSVLRSALIEAYLSIGDEVEEPSLHIENQIYDGFYTTSDQEKLDAFHRAEWADRALLSSQMEDKRARQISSRLIYFERPHLLDDVSRIDYDIAIAKRLLADEKTVPWLTLPKAIAEIDHLLETAEESKQGLLNEHREYLLDRLEIAARILNTI